MNVYDEIEKFLEREKTEAEKAKEAEKNQVSIDPDSYIAKEIKYQTAMLHQMKAEIMEIKGEMRSRCSSSRKKPFIFKGKSRGHKRFT